MHINPSPTIFSMSLKYYITILPTIMPTTNYLMKAVAKALSEHKSSVAKQKKMLLISENRIAPSNCLYVCN